MVLSRLSWQPFATGEVKATMQMSFLGLSQVIFYSIIVTVTALV